MVNTQQLWVLRTEGGEDGDFESLHATEISAYIDAASMLREAWRSHFTEQCPIDYRGTEKTFIKSVKEAMETWQEFRNDEGAFSDIVKDDAPLLKWSPWCYEIRKADSVTSGRFNDAQVQWFKEDVDGVDLSKMP